MRARAWGSGVLVLALLVVSPALVSEYTLTSVLTQALWLGLAASTMTFLSAYGGMVSLAQVGVYAVAGFTLANTVTTESSKGLNLGWNPWLSVLAGVVVATIFGTLIGAIGSRSTGIYFLMLTLIFGVIVNLFFGSVVELSGFSGISAVRTIGPVGDPVGDPARLFYVALVCCVVFYLLMRYLVRTPFGLTLQGIRDDPVRMSSLGYRVSLHRTVAFGFAAFVASFAGILFTWWNDQSIQPSSVGVERVLDLLVIAVIGGLGRIEGAWIGALFFTLIATNIQNYTVDIPLIGALGERFHTVLGLIFLVIVLVSPGGIVGLGESLVTRIRKSAPPTADAAPASG